MHIKKDGFKQFKKNNNPCGMNKVCWNKTSKAFKEGFNSLKMDREPKYHVSLS